MCLLLQSRITELSMEDGSTVTDMTEMANMFNEFFINIASNLRVTTDKLQMVLVSWRTLSHLHLIIISHSLIFLQWQRKRRLRWLKLYRTERQRVLTTLA